MLRLTSIPVPTASTQELLVEIEETLCQPYCVNSSTQPIASATFTTGTVTLLNGNAIIPIIATVVVTTPDS